MSANRPAFQITARYAPSLGSRAVQIGFDLADAALFEGDMYYEVENGKIDYIQSIKIDNADNPEQFILEFPGIGERGDRVIAAPFTIGTYPIFIPVNSNVHYLARSVQADGVEVIVSFFNIELPYSVNTVLSSAPAPSVVTGTATSGAVLLTGADQIALAANANRIRATIQNPPNNANSIWINFGIAATADAGSQEIPPGQQFDTGTGPLSLADIHMIGTAGQSVNVTQIVSP
jgi:hypothetical protein